MRILLIVFVALGIAACGGGGADPTATPPPNTPVPSLTPTSPATATPEATPEATDLASAELTPEVTDTVIDVIVEADEGQAIPPPIEITLPEGWQSIDNTIPVQDLSGLQVLPFTSYVGPVTDGTGVVILLWGFESIAIGDAMAGEAQLSLGGDALRLLRLAVATGCNIGTDLELSREFTVGDRTAQGTYFQAVDCPETVDTRGWFAALNVSGINMAFYAYTEPIAAMDGPAEDELQTILDQVMFRPEQVVITVTPGGE